MDMSKPSIAPPILASIFILMLYMMSGAAILAEAQSWSYNDALYYCFVSLFTIGFGGLRPKDPHMWVCALYILMGVTILSTCCHLLHQEVTSSLEKYKSVKRRNRILLTEIEAAKNSNSELSWPENSKYPEGPSSGNFEQNKDVAVQCEQENEQCTCDPNPDDQARSLMIHKVPILSPDETLSPASSSSACSTCSEPLKNSQFKRIKMIKPIQEESEISDDDTENQIVISV